MICVEFVKICHKVTWKPNTFTNKRIKAKHFFNFHQFQVHSPTH